jgi:hypothetical protein
MKQICVESADSLAHQDNSSSLSLPSLKSKHRTLQTHQGANQSLIIDAGFDRETRDRAVQSILVDGTHECIPGQEVGQHFFCEIEPCSEPCLPVAISCVKLYATAIYCAIQNPAPGALCDWERRSPVIKTINDRNTVENKSRRCRRFSGFCRRPAQCAQILR